jgi:hypothetical protein
MLALDRICGAILEELRRHMDRERAGQEDENAYLDQEVLAERLHKFYRITLTKDELHSPLTVLKDARYAEYKRVPFGPPKRRLWMTVWRITGEGVRLLNGDIEDPRVKVLFW